MPERPNPAPAPEFRYGAVFVLTLLIVVWLIVGPSTAWARAIGFALEGSSLVVVILTSREHAQVRRLRAVGSALLVLAIASASAAGALPSWAVPAAGGILSVAIPLLLTGGLLRLVRTQGVTLQAVAGSLAIYLLVGLAFAWIMGLVAAISKTPYFSGGTDATQSARVYFSFTVLTTTGFGDLTAGSATGRALAVLEMLTGQLYLVTVLGVVIGNLRRRDG